MIALNCMQCTCTCTTHKYPISLSQQFFYGVSSELNCIMHTKCLLTCKKIILHTIYSAESINTIIGLWHLTYRYQLQILLRMEMSVLTNADEKSSLVEEVVISQLICKLNVLRAVVYKYCLKLFIEKKNRKSSNLARM